MQKPPVLLLQSLFKGSLLLLTLMIFLLILVGGLTRLTGAGLSIVEWKPITGILPPLSLEEWGLEFAKYQQTPEFQKINSSLTLGEFKSIFWLEYFHRLIARGVGLFLLIPTCLLLVCKDYRPLWPFIVLLWILGMCQAAVGWFMVKSGLLSNPYVSPYRLAAHLFLGFILFGLSLWATLSLYLPSASSPSRPLLKGYLCGILGLVLCTALLGACVAGLKAGLLYPTFPLMGEHLIPQEVFDNLVSPASFQFFHRLAALVTLSACWGIWFYQHPLPLSSALHTAFTGIACLAFFQVSLGISTLLWGVPWGLALLHQGFAFVLFGNVLYTLFLIKTDPTDTL